MGETVSTRVDWMQVLPILGVGTVLAAAITAWATVYVKGREGKSSDLAQILTTQRELAATLRKELDAEREARVDAEGDLRAMLRWSVMVHAGINDGTIPPLPDLPDVKGAS